MKALLKTGKIIEIIPNDDLNAAKYVDKETSEYIFDDEIEEILTYKANDINDAATEYVSTLCNRADEGLRIDTTLESAFKSGADWMAEQNGKERQMMIGAVETTVHLEPGAFPVIEIGVGKFGLKVGDKVKVIIVKDI